MNSIKFLKEIQYPKLLILLICIILAYIFFKADFFEGFSQLFNSHGYISIFIAGFLFAYGFTAPFAVGFFISLASSVNIFIAGPLAGLGALIADLLIFQFIKTSFQDEFDKLKLTRFFQRVKLLFENHLSDKIRRYVLWTVAGFIIASPLPDEFGVSLLSGFTSIDKKAFIPISYVLNTAGIMIILAIS